MSDRPTPETEKMWDAWADERLPNGQFRYGPADLADHARRLERQRDDAREMYFGLLEDHEATVMQRDAYAETLREIAANPQNVPTTLRLAQQMTDRHPELAGNVHCPVVDANEKLMP